MEENMNQEDVSTGKKSNSTWIIIAVIIVIGGIFFYYTKMNKDDMLPENLESKSMEQSESQLSTLSTPDTTTVSSPMPDSMADTSNENVKTVNIEAGSFYYKPNVIEVKKGQKVKIVMTAADMMHNFNIDELNVKMPIVKSGNTGTVEFTADKVGEFEFYCSVSNHRAKGQVGTLKVTE